MNLFNTSYELINTFIEAIVMLMVFLRITGRRDFIRVNKVKAILFVVLYIVFVYWATRYIPYGYHSVCAIAFAAVSLSYIAQTHLFKSIIGAAVGFLVLMISEYIIIFVVMGILKINLKEAISRNETRIVLAILSKSLEFAFCYILYKIKFSLFSNNEQEKKNSLSSLIVLQALIMSLFVMSLNYAASDTGNNVKYNILLTAMYLVLIVLGIIDFRERIGIQKIQQKFEAQQEYVKNIEEVIDIIRREKHDFMNHMNTILAMCVLKRPDSLEKVESYTRKLTNELKSSYRFFNTGSDFIDGLLAIKSNYAFENDIHIEVDIEVPLNLAAVDDGDLTSIMGNIVDNALEAVMTEPGRESKVVSILTYVEDDNYFISVSDNGPAIPEKYIEKIFESGFSTKGKNKKDHGYGLFITKQLVKRNGGEIAVNSTQEETEFVMKFRVRKCNNEKAS